MPTEWGTGVVVSRSRLRQQAAPAKPPEQVVNLTHGQVAKALLSPDDDWNIPAPALGVLDDTFHLYLIRHDADTVLLDPITESVDWDEGAAPTGYMTGSLGLRVQDAKMGVKPGDLVALWVRDGDGRFKEWWRMKVLMPQIDYLSGTRTFALASDLHRLFDSLAEHKYVKGPGHPNGWTGKQVFEDIAERYEFKLGELPTLNTRMLRYGPKIDSPAAVLAQVLNHEHKETGVRYLLTYEHGVMGLRQKQRSERMLLLGPLLIQAGYQATMAENFATAIHMRSSIAASIVVDPASGKRITQVPDQLLAKDGLRVFVKDQSGIDRYGLITKMGWTFVDSRAKLRTRAIQHLALLERPMATISATHPGVAGLRKFDAVKVQVNTDPEIFQKVLFVDNVSFSLSAGQFNMSVSLKVDDPLVKLPDTFIYDTINEAQNHRQAVITRAQGKHVPKPPDGELKWGNANIGQFK